MTFNQYQQRLGNLYKLYRAVFHFERSPILTRIYALMADYWSSRGLDAGEIASLQRALNPTIYDGRLIASGTPDTPNRQ